MKRESSRKSELEKTVGGDEAAEGMMGALNIDMGSALWAAPELIKAEEADTATDVYAFGVLIFECLANKIPWEGKNGKNARPTPPFRASLPASSPHP